MLIQRMAIIGVGLIGGSLAQALRRAKECREIVGCGRSEANLQRAVELGVVDRYCLDAAEAVDGADMIVLAVPLSANAAVFEAIRPRIAPGAVITDVGSVKTVVAGAARQHLGRLVARFVPGHPVAGTERSGVEASFADLFQERRTILTPLAETDHDAVEKVSRMWRAAGAHIDRMDLHHHDEILAATSHLPHVLAYALVDCLATLDASREVFKFAAGGFADFTRIASSSPEMWHDIVMANREAVLQSLVSFQTHLDRATRAVRNSDAEALLAIFARAKAARDRYTGTLGTVGASR